MKIKKGDIVRVIAGKEAAQVVQDKDKKPAEGKVLSVDAKRGRVVVEGLHKVTKHEKPSMTNQNGGRVEVEASIDISNVMLLHNGKPTRVGFKIEDGKKYRYAKATGEKIDEVTSAKRK
ncbi:MAG: 50S ribosomal protein L24, partial [Lachnospiraceae bacterium]|nr:50S ribosomal protein L24 [Lachnospiraceae bacterium]